MVYEIGYHEIGCLSRGRRRGRRSARRTGSPSRWKRVGFRPYGKGREGGLEARQRRVRLPRAGPCGLALRGVLPRLPRPRAPEVRPRARCQAGEHWAPRSASYSPSCPSSRCIRTSQFHRTSQGAALPAGPVEVRDTLCRSLRRPARALPGQPTARAGHRRQQLSSTQGHRWLRARTAARLRLLRARGPARAGSSRPLDPRAAPVRRMQTLTTAATATSAPFAMESAKTETMCLPRTSSHPTSAT